MISAADRTRLEALLGMLGSQHVGERENAARLVEQFRQRLGVSWSDLLTRPPVSTRLSAPPPPDAAPVVIQLRCAGDTVWRWSMLVGLVALGALSFVSIAQQNKLTAGAPANDSLYPVSDHTPLGQAAAATIPGQTVATANTNTPGGSHNAPSGFSRGQADRKLWETWRTSGSAAICSGHFSRAQEELRSACATALKLLAQFDRRRRTDYEYRRGWNSASLQ